MVKRECSDELLHSLHRCQSEQGIRFLSRSRLLVLSLARLACETPFLFPSHPPTLITLRCCRLQTVWKEEEEWHIVHQAQLPLSTVWLVMSFTNLGGSKWHTNLDILNSNEIPLPIQTDVIYYFTWLCSCIKLVVIFLAMTHKILTVRPSSILHLCKPWHITVQIVFRARSTHNIVIDILFLQGCNNIQMCAT